MTELNLLNQFILSWNALNVFHIKEHISKDVIYESQWVLNSIKGKSEVLNYLKRKFETIKKEMKSKLILIYAVIGYLPSMNFKPCIILSQIISDKLNQVIILIEVNESKISRIDICFIPDPGEAVLRLPKGKEGN